MLNFIIRSNTVLSMVLTLKNSRICSFKEKEKGVSEAKQQDMMHMQRAHRAAVCQRPE